MRESGFAATILIVVILVILLLVGGGFFAFSQGLIKLPSQQNSSQTNTTNNPSPLPQKTQESSKSAQPNVTLKTEYQNPFDQDASYQNPFEENNNPFDNLQ